MILKAQLPLYITIAGVGIATGLLLKNPASPTHATTQEQKTPDIIPDEIIVDSELETFRNEINKLKQQITEESKLRKKLQDEMVALQKRVNQPTVISSTIEAKPSPEEDDKRTYKTRPRLSQKKAKEWFNYDALIVAGVQTNEANRLRKLYDGIEIEKLYLRDRAAREKWINDDKYQTELSALEGKFTSLRNELDDPTYDAFLFASGRSNRVVVQSVLSTSPAAEAGIQAGDQIISYGGSKIYSWSDLSKATASGQASELAEVIVKRSGTKMSFYVPRGPLGIRLENISVQP